MILDKLSDEFLFSQVVQQGWLHLNWVDGYEPFRADRSRRSGQQFYRPEVLEFLHTFVPDLSRSFSLSRPQNVAGIESNRFRLDLGPIGRWRVLRGFPIQESEDFPLCRVAVFSGGCPHKVIIFPTGANMEDLCEKRDSSGKTIGYDYLS